MIGPNSCRRTEDLKESSSGVPNTKHSRDTCVRPIQDYASTSAMLCLSSVQCMPILHCTDYKGTKRNRRPSCKTRAYHVENSEYNKGAGHEYKRS